MLNKLIKISCLIMLFPVVCLGSGDIDCKAYTPTSDKCYKTGWYAGIQGGYIYVIDEVGFDATNPSNINFIPIEETNHQNAGIGGVFAGYGYLFDHGNLPYLGGEVGFNIRSHYNGGDNINNGEIYGKKINGVGNLSIDVMPGFFTNDYQTTLIYLRLGVEGDRFDLDNDAVSDTSYQLLYRAGGGIEHEITNSFYIRADYVFAASPNHIDFEPYNNHDDRYYSKPMFNTFTIGLDYRF